MYSGDLNYHCGLLTLSKIFIPHVWPVHDKAMQLRAVAVGACLLTGNFLNIMIPRQLGVVTDALVKGKSAIPDP